MAYPLEIQPNPRYKNIKVGLNDYYIIRSIPTNDCSKSNLIDPVTNQLKGIHICEPDKRIDDLSTSLLGHFKITHNAISTI